jgi:hypothetical protein
MAYAFLKAKYPTMKTFFLFIAIALTVQLNAQEWSMKDLFGTWKADNGAGLEVADSTRLYLLFNEQKKEILDLKVNFNTIPGTMDFKVRDSAGLISLQSLFQFVNRDLVQWQVFEGKRPLNFTASEGELVYLRRKE